MDIALDDIHDIFVENQDLALTNTVNEVKQDLSIRLQFVFGEWFLDNTVGVPYPQIIFEKNTDISTVYYLFRDEIKNTDKIKEIKSLVITPDEKNKSISVSFEALDINNNIVSENILIGV